VRTKAEQLVRLLRTALGNEAPIRVQAGGGLSFAEGRMGVEQILATRPAAQHGG
jgi:hypothetical protein